MPFGLLPQDYTITTSRLIIRPPEPQAATAVLAYIIENQTYLTPWEPLRSANYYTLAFHQEQIRNELSERERGLGVRFYIRERYSPGTIIGMINLANVVRGAGQFCTTGYSLAESVQGRGYMTEALTAVVEFAFNKIGLHRVQANYIPRNERSGHVLRRCGFLVEGYARDYLMINGRWEDHILTAITKPE